MSLDLPPPPAPQEVSRDKIPARDGAITLRFYGLTLHISGAPITSAQLDEALIGSQLAQTVEQAMKRIGNAVFVAGYPAAQVLWAKSGADVYVLIKPGAVSGVRADAPLDRYFADLVGIYPLTDNLFERRRVLASLHADRAGVDALPRFVPDARGDGSVMEITTAPADPLPWLRLEFGNPGNRFVGRHFIEAEVTLDNRYGDEFHLMWRDAPSSINENARGGRYHEPSLSWDRVTRWGVFGAKALYADYRYRQTFSPVLFGPPDTPLKGELLQGEVSWLVPLLADFDRRWSGQAALDYNDKTTEREDNGESLQEERYTSLELTSAYLRTLSLFDRTAEAESALTLRKGLNNTGRGVIASDLDYVLLRPTVSFKYSWNEDFSSTLALAGQLSGDTLPEQEQFLLGGLGSMSAYLPGAAVGDQGYVLALSSTWTRQWWGHEFLPRIFLEYGGARLQQVSPGQRATHQRLGDAGAEIGVILSRFFEGSFTYSVPLYDEGIDQATLNATQVNFYFRVAAKF